MANETEREPEPMDDDRPADAPVETAAPALAELNKALEAARAQAAEYLDGWQRARADFTNYKRRVEKEQVEADQAATARVVGRFLDVVDDFDRAMADRPGPGADEAAVARWADGVGLIQRKLQTVLDAFSVERIAAEGQPFDPTWHEAITHEDSDAHAPNHIIGVVRHGYKLGDRVIRPALVRVAR
jgi:molecular chaperone GrpE